MTYSDKIVKFLNDNPGQAFTAREISIGADVGSAGLHTLLAKLVADGQATRSVASTGIYAWQTPPPAAAAPAPSTSSPTQVAVLQLLTERRCKMSALEIRREVHRSRTAIEGALHVLERSGLVELSVTHGVYTWCVPGADPVADLLRANDELRSENDELREQLRLAKGLLD